MNPSCQPSGDIEHSLADDPSRGEPGGRLVRLDLRGQRDVSDDFTVDGALAALLFSSVNFPLLFCTRDHLFVLEDYYDSSVRYLNRGYLR